MKKFLHAILFMSFFLISTKVFAYEINYSEWSTNYPNGIDEMFIESEDRYLWVREQKVNEQYLPITNIGNKVVDYDNYIYSKESKPSLTKPEEIEGRIIKEYSESTTYPEDSIKKLVLNEYDFYDEVKISEIDIVDSFSGEKINIISNNNAFLYDGDLDNYTKIENNIEFVFDECVSIDNIIIKIYYDSKSNKSSFDFSLFSEDNHRLHYKKYLLNDEVIIVNKDDLQSDYYLVVTKYTYSDKLYKTYEILRDVTNEYYKEYPGYEKIEESKTTYYRYITNDMVLLDSDGNIVTDNDYCKKSFCTVAYLTKKEEVEEETPNNPQTIDNVNYYIILLLASLVGIIVTFRKKIYLVMSNRFKRR